MKRDVLVTLADKGYLERSKQLFYSAVAKGGWEGDLVLLAYNVPDSDLTWFVDRGILIYHCPEWEMPGTSGGGHPWPPVVWHKLHILKPYFRQWRTVVFLDGDIIIRSCIQSLANAAEFMAVKTGTNIRNECKDLLSTFLSGADWRLRIKIGKRYGLHREEFNSGLMAFPTSMIEEDMFDKACEIRKTCSPLFLVPEQVTFNLLFPCWKALPAAYSIFPVNIEMYTHMKPEDIRGITVHFISEKPWFETHPFYSEWKESYDKACSTKSLEIDKDLITMSDAEIAAIEEKMVAEFLKGRFKRLKRRFCDRMEWCIGICGLIIRRISPRAYCFLKGIRYAKKP